MLLYAPHTQKEKSPTHRQAQSVAEHKPKKYTLEDTSTLLILPGVVYHTSTNILFIQVKVPEENIDPAD